jgi:GrpB-like predicted nucleotidyltransferase (UPF0157 family)
MRLLDTSDYQPRAAAIYDSLAAEFQLLLPGAVIEHIGSSAIPGAVSKGDLDVFIGVSADQFEQAAATIERVGFRLKPETLQTTQLHHFVTDRYPMDVTVQLVDLGSEFEFFRTFRDLLNRGQGLRNRYNAVKHGAADLDEEGYRECKTQFIEETLRAHR